MSKHIFIPYLALFLFCFAPNKGESANYYFSSATGIDSRTSTEARNMLTPWKTLTKLNAFMSSLQPGDSVLFKRGEVFYGSFTVTKSGTASLPITFSAYGSGVKPVISGLTNLSTWTNKSTNVWEADCPTCGTSVNNLLINDIPQQIGRYPNITDQKKGYLFFESHVSKTQITDNQLPASPDWTGGELVVRTNHWLIDRAPIVSHAGNIINYTGTSSYVTENNWGYFIQNHPQTLDKYGEWYYNPATKKVLVYTNAANPSAVSVEVATVGTLVTVQNQKYIRLNNLEFTGSNTVAIDLSYAQYVNINNCAISSSGLNGINAISSSYIVFENNTISNTKNNALYFYWDCNYSTIRNNSILNTGLFPGSGKNNMDSYIALTIYGTQNLVEYNNIDSTGYIPIFFIGDYTTVKNNYITNFLFTKDDGGGIYLGGDGCASTTILQSRKIIGNILLNGIGAPEGTNNIYGYAWGIDLDDNTSNVEVNGNTMSNMEIAGLFLHNAHEITITNNTSYNNEEQFSIEYGNCPAGLIRNISFNNNILFAKTASQLIFNFQTSANDAGSFGVFDNNYYCRPLNENQAMAVNTSRYNLAQWQVAYGKDANSKTTPLKFTSNPDDNIRFEYNATQTPKVIALAYDYIDVKSASYTGSLTLQPYTSVILLKKSGSTTISDPVIPEKSISVFPNPAKEYIIVQFEEPSLENVELVLTNSVGQKVLSVNLPAETLSEKVDLNHLPSGIYVLELSEKTKTSTRKVIISR